MSSYATGLFSDETAWAYVTPILEAAGASVSLVTLPGHADADMASAGGVTMNDYVGAVAAKIAAAEGPVILVGHSMGGVAITQTSEHHPEKIAALVYLSAYLPENGKSLFDYSQDPESVLGPNIAIDQEHGVGTITTETMRAAFFNTTPADRAEAALARLRPEPLQPFVTPVTTTAANFGSIPRYYITTTADRAVGPSLQQAMVAAQPVRKLYSLAADHSSYFSATDNLAGVLLEVAREIA